MALDGYLSSVPEGGDKNRRSSWVTEYPERGHLFYLYDWLREFGLMVDGREITFTDIKSWSELTCRKVTPDEAVAMCELSRVWINEYRGGRLKEAVPPWFPEFD